MQNPVHGDLRKHCFRKPLGSSFFETTASAVRKEYVNARQQLAAVVEWLGWNEENLSFGLRNSVDALRLYDYAQAHPGRLPEMADEWQPKDRIAALGYDPLTEAEAALGREVGASGATAAYAALRQARALLGSVAFVASEGDSDSVLHSIDAALSSAPSRHEAVAAEGAPMGVGLEAAAIFKQELDSTFYSLTAMADLYGVRTLADLFHLYEAILDESYVVQVQDSNLVELLKELPSGNRWLQFVETGDLRPSSRE